MFQKISGSQKVYGWEVEVSRFVVESFLSHSAESFVGEPFGLSLISVIEKNYASEGHVTIFRRKIFCLTVPKRFVEEPMYAVFQKTSGGEKVYG